MAVMTEHETWDVEPNTRVDKAFPASASYLYPTVHEAYCSVDKPGEGAWGLRRQNIISYNDVRIFLPD
jgi:hypothetical protein